MPSVRLTDDFRNKITRVFGDDGARWLERLPALLADCETRWRLKLDLPYELSYNYVAPARRADGSRVVLKAGVPNEERLCEIEALRLDDGRAMVRLLDHDAAEGVSLLELLQPGTPLAELADDEAATEIACALMLRLWRPPPARHAFPTVERWSRAFERLRAEHAGGTGPLPADLVEIAERSFVDLCASTSEPVLLHGDFHHWNILSAEREPWLVIDPKGVVGDRGFEAGPFLSNRLLELAEPRRALARRVDQLSARLRIDRDRLMAWGLAHAMLSAAWSAEDEGTGWGRAITLAQMLRAMS